MHPHFMIDMIAWAFAFGAGYMAHILRRNTAITALHLPISYYITLSIGALVGAFVLGSANLWLSSHEAAVGRSIVGALSGGILFIEIYKKITGLKGSTGGTFVAAFSVGTAVGRIGCYVSGLEDFTYGLPTSLPWGVDFGDGITRHPVQLYEASVMGIFALVYFIGLVKSAKWAVKSGFYYMVLVYGFDRFVLEFLKPYATLFGPFNLFHIVCAGLTLYAIYMLRRQNGYN